MAGAVALAAWVLWPRHQPRGVETVPAPSSSPSPMPIADGGILRTLDGRVIDGGGHAVAGARVEVVGALPPRVADPAGELGVLRGPIPFPPPRPAALGPFAMTDADGRFRLTEVAPGRVVLSVTHPQLAPRAVEVTAGPVEIALAPLPPAPSVAPPLVEVGTQHLAGTVVDDRGFPLAGARVETGGHSALSDAAGRFVIDGLPPGPYQVRATHSDFAPAEATLAGGDEVQLQLVVGGGIEGELRDGSGGVPAGASLELFVDGRTLALALRGGRFTATGVRAGRVVLSARAPGYVPARLEVEVPPGDRPGDLTARDLRVTLERGGVISGSVRGDDGEPVSGAHVAAGAANGRTDARGFFRLEGVAAGRLHVTASEGARRAGEDVEVRAGDETRVELTLR